MTGKGLPWPWIGAGALILLGIPAMLNKPRGLRNHNPMNVEDLGTGEKWDGQISVDTAGGRAFAVFGDTNGQPADFWGLRAGGHNYLTYQREHGLYTLRGIINRATPPEDGNNTTAYLANVSAAVGLDPDQTIFLAPNRQLLAEIMKAVVVEEQGHNPFGDDLVLQAAQAA